MSPVAGRTLLFRFDKLGLLRVDKYPPLRLLFLQVPRSRERLTNIDVIILAFLDSFDVK